MSTVDWPEALIPQAASLQLRKSGRQFSGPFNGTLQAVDDLAERWVLSATLPPRRRRDGTAGVESFCATLAGGINRVRAWHFGTRGMPAGSLRGTPTLSSPAARGNLTLILSTAAGATLMADDMFSVGGQLFQVAASCTATGGGALTVPLVNRVRGTIAGGSAVTWYRPTAEFIMPAMQSGTVWQPGRLEAAGVDLVEVW
jgi:hypothetical protein